MLERSFCCCATGSCPPTKSREEDYDDVNDADLVKYYLFFELLQFPQIVTKSLGQLVYCSLVLKADNSKVRGCVFKSRILIWTLDQIP